MDGELRVLFDTRDRAVGEATLAEARRQTPSESAFGAYLSTGNFSYLLAEAVRADAAAPIELQSLWVQFMDRPCVETATALCGAAGIARSVRRAASTAPPSAQTAQTASAVAVSGGMPLSRRLTYSPAADATLRQEYAAIMSMDALHDLSALRLDRATRQAMATWVFPGIAAQEARSFADERRGFNGKVSGFLQARLALPLPEFTVNQFLWTAAQSEAFLQALRPRSGVLEIVMDGIVKRSHTTMRNSILAAFVLLLLNDVYRLQTPAGEVFEKDAALETRITHIRFLDGTFMEQDSLCLPHFVNQYVHAVYQITAAHVSVAMSAALPTFFKHYARADVVSMEHVVKLPPYAFSIFNAHRMNEADARVWRDAQTYDLATWHLPYPKSALQELVSVHWGDPAAHDKLRAVLQLNFLRDAHRCDLASRRGALLVTTDGISAVYLAWLRAHHPNVRAHGLHLALTYTGDRFSDARVTLV